MGDASGLSARVCGACGAAENAATDKEPPSTPAVVTVGAYLNNVQELALKEHSYEADLYIWFRWRDEALSPAETVEIVNPNQLWGTVSDALYEEPLLLPTGERYQVLRVQGRFSRKFLFHNYPFDRQQLVVDFEDSVHETNRMVYVCDQNPVAINPHLLLPGFRLGTPRLDVTTFSYPTTFGDPRRSEPGTYSRAQLALPISRPLLTSVLKMLLPVLCVGLGPP